MLVGRLGVCLLQVGQGMTWQAVVNLFRKTFNQCQEIVNLSSTTSDNRIRKRHRTGGVSPTRWCAGCTVSPHCAPAGRLVWCYWRGVSSTRMGGDNLLVVSIRVMKTLHWHPLFLPRVSKTRYLGNTTLSKAQCGDSQPRTPPACRRHDTASKRHINQNQEKTNQCCGCYSATVWFLFSVVFGLNNPFLNCSTVAL